MDYIVRLATKNDIKELAILKQKVWDETYRGIYPDFNIDNFDYEKAEKRFLKIINNSNMVLYVVLINNVIVGYMSCGNPVRKYANYEQELSLLYLVKEYQKKGIGSKLFNLAYDKIKESGYHNFLVSCNKYNNGAREFYEKMGGKLIFEDEDSNLKMYVQAKYHFDIK